MRRAGASRAASAVGGGRVRRGRMRVGAVVGRCWVVAKQGVHEVLALGPGQDSGKAQAVRCAADKGAQKGKMHAENCWVAGIRG